MRNFLRGAFNIGMIASVLLSSNAANAQTKKHEWLQPDIRYVDKRGFSLGMTFGMTEMWADVGTKSPLDKYTNLGFWESPKFMGGIYGRYTHLPGLSVRLSVNNGTVYSTDEWNRDKALIATNYYADEVQRYMRNLDVKTNIWESTLMLEISPLELLSNWELGRAAYWRFQPYVMVGVGGIYFNPRGTNIIDFTTNQKEWVDLRPLHTEGQNFDKPGYPKAYNEFALIIPAGVGFRVDIGKQLGLGLEYVMRYAFTDYLDDVSGKYIDPLRFDIGFLNEGHQPNLAKKMADRSNEITPGARHAAGTYRGDPNNNDMYSTISLNFFWRIYGRDTPWWR